MQRTYMNRWKQFLKESNQYDHVNSIVQDKIKAFTDETMNRFLDVMSEIEMELAAEGVNAIQLQEAEMHFQTELFRLQTEIVEKIHEDEELQQHIRSSNMSGASHH